MDSMDVPVFCVDILVVSKRRYVSEEWRIGECDNTIPRRADIDPIEREW